MRQGGRVTANGVSLTIDGDEGSRRESYDFVPLYRSARRTALIEWSPALSQRKREACERLYYASAAKTIMHFESRLWEHRVRRRWRWVVQR